MSARRWFQLYLSTLLALTFVFGAGLFVMLQEQPGALYSPPGESPRYGVTRGWPLTFYVSTEINLSNTGTPDYAPVVFWRYRELAVDVALLLGLCAVSGALLETAIRARRPR